MPVCNQQHTKKWHPSQVLSFCYPEHYTSQAQPLFWSFPKDQCCLGFIKMDRYGVYSFVLFCFCLICRTPSTRQASMLFLLLYILSKYSSKISYSIVYGYLSCFLFSIWIRIIELLISVFWGTYIHFYSVDLAKHFPKDISKFTFPPVLYLSSSSSKSLDLSFS
jgi:hypothetical protein